MKKNKIDAYIVNSSDGHFSEYSPEFMQDRKWLTGFTGSNGYCLVSQDEALLWTDGRYFIQAEEELRGSSFQMMRINHPDDPDIYQYLNSNMPGAKLGLNPVSTSISKVKDLESKLNPSIGLTYDLDLISRLWTDRPKRDPRPAYVHPLSYAKRSVTEKVGMVQEGLKKAGADLTLISSLDDLAWLFNIRGHDIDHNPYVLSYGLVDLEGAHIFIDKEKLTQDLEDHLKENKVQVHPYGHFESKLGDLGQEIKVYLDPDKSSIGLLKYLDKDQIISGDNITTGLKAIKTPEEIQMQKNAYIKDGLALTHFIYWIKTHPDISRETESSARKYLDDLRACQDLYVSPSFDTISAYGPNGAMMHYNDSGQGISLAPRSFYLVDSGGQYLDGTTDITRTLALGPLTEEEKTDFTLVLKGMLDLSTTVFLEGTTGSHLDAIARRPIWGHHMDYKSGTGHGIGYFLGVHEGPHSIRPGSFNPVALKPGMIVSIEPGIYKEGKYGIRLENIVYVKEAGQGPDGKFLEFETMSLAPIDLDAIDARLLNQDQKEALNTYHKKVYDSLAPYLNDEIRAWLKEVTRKI